MRSVSVSELKARLSEHLRHVRAGERVVVTDRGRPVALLIPTEGSPDGRLDQLEQRGMVTIGSGTLPKGFWAKRRPRDVDGRLGAAVRRERESGW